MKNILQNDDKTREELLENLSIEKTTDDDALEILRIFKENLHVFTYRFAMEQLLNTNTLFEQSVKAIDKRDGKIYGLLLLGRYHISYDTPILNGKESLLREYLKQKSLVHGFAFVLDDRLKGTRTDRNMLMHNMPFIESHDMIWLGVENGLNTERYWQYLGFIEISKKEGGSFYVRPRDKKDSVMVFILKALIENESNNKQEPREKTV